MTEFNLMHGLALQEFAFPIGLALQEKIRLDFFYLLLWHENLENCREREARVRENFQM